MADLGSFYHSVIVLCKKQKGIIVKNYAKQRDVYYTHIKGIIDALYIADGLDPLIIFLNIAIQSPMGGITYFCISSLTFSEIIFNKVSGVLCAFPSLTKE